ncbi:MAG: sulfotransferase family protein [Planctomycetota bacterium]
MEAIVVVTGLPRSGTSMLMQMLAAGGVPIFTDRLRQADDDNPSGYFEHEAVKRLASDAAWLAEAAGQAVKIVAPLIPAIPEGMPLKVLLIERALDEVIASQEKMMQRLGTSGAALPAERLKAVFAQQLARAKAFLDGRGDAETVSLAYRETVNDPATCAKKINAFFGGSLDKKAMAAAVNPKLYRNRSD